MFQHDWYHEINGALLGIPTSYYGDTEFAATNEISDGERAILEDFEDDLPAEMRNDAPVDFTFGDLNLRQRQRLAINLLNEAGYTLENGRLVNATTSDEVVLEFVSSNPMAVQYLLAYDQRLERIGISLKLTRMDPAASQRMILDYAFDLTTAPWRPQSTPGIFENLFWHSSQVNGRGFGLAGLDNPAVDAAIALINSSRDWGQTISATRALDRILRASYVAIPMWHRSDAFIAHDARLSFPDDFDANFLPAESWWWSSTKKE